MHILVSNDDGINAPGIRTLVEAVRPLGKITVIAPEENQSVSGHKKTLTAPLRIRSVEKFADGVEAYGVNGSPSDCVAVAMLGFVKEPVDLVVSGINRGPNIAQDVTYSGTVAVALEAAIFGLPGIAFSLDNRRADADYTHTIGMIRQVVEKTHHSGLPPLTILNVNFPAGPAIGYKITRQGVREYRDELIERVDPYGQSYYWIGGEEPGGDTGVIDTDLWAIHHDYVSITPIHLDLTAHAQLETMRAWKFDI